MLSSVGKPEALEDPEEEETEDEDDWLEDEREEDPLCAWAGPGVKGAAVINGVAGAAAAIGVDELAKPLFTCVVEAKNTASVDALDTSRSGQKASSSSQSGSNAAALPLD